MLFVDSDYVLTGLFFVLLMVLGSVTTPDELTSHRGIASALVFGSVYVAIRFTWGWLKARRHAAAFGEESLTL